MSNWKINLPARGWWERREVEARLREKAIKAGHSASAIGDATIVKHQGRECWQISIYLPDDQAALFKLANT